MVLEVKKCDKHHETKPQSQYICFLWNGLILDAKVFCYLSTSEIWPDKMGTSVIHIRWGLL